MDVQRAISGRSGATAIDDAWTGRHALTPEQVTAMLRASGALERGRVVSVRPASLGVGEAMMSELVRLHLEYGRPTPPGAPTSLVVKLPCREPFRRQIADRFGFYARELAFYSQLAGRTPVRTPRCHAQAYDPTTGEFMLVLEDVGAKRAVVQADGCGWNDALAVVDTLAALHAPWWGRADVLPDAVVPMDLPAKVSNLVTTFLNSWPTCRARAGERLPPELVAIGDRWEEIGPRLARRIAAPSTLCHGDVRADNMRFDDAGVVLFDWQLITRAHGVTDVAYFAAQSMRTAARAGRDRLLLDCYLAASRDRGVAVDGDDAWEVYRTSVLAMVIFPVTLYGTYDDLDTLGRRTTDAMLDRSVAAITELDACAVPAALA